MLLVSKIILCSGAIATLASLALLPEEGDAVHGRREGEQVQMQALHAQPANASSLYVPAADGEPPCGATYRNSSCNFWALLSNTR
jgi:hypothetical protein